MPKSDDDEYHYYSEKQIKRMISTLLFEIEKLKDENDSLWFVLEEMEKRTDSGDQILNQLLVNLKDYKASHNMKPEEA